MAAGLSLHSFAVMTTKGAMLPRVRIPSLFGLGIGLGFWQTLSLLLGNSTIAIGLVSNHTKLSLQVIAVLIFAGLGFFMLHIGIKEESINEHCVPRIKPKELFDVAVTIGVYALLAGLGLACLNIALSFPIICLIVVMNTAAVVSGIYVGYYFGYEQRVKAYTVGGSIFLVFGAWIFFVHVVSSFI